MFCVPELKSVQASTRSAPRIARNSSPSIAELHRESAISKLLFTRSTEVAAVVPDTQELRRERGNAPVSDLFDGPRKRCLPWRGSSD